MTSYTKEPFMTIVHMIEDLDNEDKLLIPTTEMKRVDIKKILQDPGKKKELIVGVIQFLQNIEGINTTKEQAENAYDKVQREFK